MIVTVERDELAEAVAACARVAGRLPPVLAGCWVAAVGESLEVLCGDLEVWVSRTVACRAGEAGVVLPPARLLADVARSLPSGAVTVESAEDGAVKVSGGRAEFSLRQLPADEWPKVPYADGARVEVPAADLLAAARRVGVAASADQSRPILTGVLLHWVDGRPRLAATDSYRLSLDVLSDLPVGEDAPVLLPARSLGELARVAAGAEKVGVTVGGGHCRFDGDGWSLTSRIIDGTFPNYRGLIPAVGSETAAATVDRDGLLESVRRVRLLARESVPVRVSARSGGLRLEAVTQDVGRAGEDFDCEVVGVWPEVVAFNPDYLADALESAPGGVVVWRVTDPRQPATLTCPASDWLHLLMPVRVS